MGLKITSHFVVLAGAALISAAQVACGGQATPTSQPAATSASAQPTTTGEAMTQATEQESMNMNMNAPFDAQFIDSMTKHHQGAIDMAKQAQAQAQQPEIKGLAGNIIKSQQAEIDEMKQWRAAWYPDLGDTGGMMMDM